MSKGQSETRMWEDGVKRLHTEHEWFQEDSPQWTEIFSPFLDACSFMEQFDEAGMSLHCLHDWEPCPACPAQSALTSSSASYASDITTPQSYRGRALNNDSDGRLYQVPVLDDTISDAAGPHSPRHSQYSARIGQAGPSFEKVAHKIAMQPADRPPERPKRTKKAPSLCSVGGCGQVFSCAYDRDRHLRDVHAQVDLIYKCEEPSCGYVRPRSDKVTEHCQKRKHDGPRSIFVGGGQNSEELAEMMAQREKKGRRQKTCKSCRRRQHQRQRS